MSCDSCSFYRPAKQDFFKNWCGKTGGLVFTRGDSCSEYKRSPIVFGVSPVKREPLAVLVAKKSFSPPRPSGVSGLSRDQVHEVFVEWSKQDPLNTKSFDLLLEKKRWASK